MKGLYTYLRSYRSDITVETIPKEPKLRIGFDAMSMLYKYKSYYEEIYPMLKELKQRGYQLLFVFDGKTPVEKEAEVKERRDNRQGATDQAASLKEQLKSQTLTMREREILEYSVARLEFQGWHMTREIRHAFQDALTSMEIPYIKAVQEADDVLVDLIGAKKLDVVVSSDMDFLLSGVERLWIPFRKIGDGFEEILLSEVLKGEGMEIGTFVDAGILCGVEPLRGRLSILSSTAFNWLRYYKSIEKLLTSTVKDAQLEILKEEELLRNTRSHFAPHPWESRIRHDHLEKHKSFLETL